MGTQNALTIGTFSQLPILKQSAVCIFRFNAASEDAYSEFRTLISVFPNFSFRGKEN